MKKIYLAGFDVFRKDAKERGLILKDLCKKYGYEGLYPLDNEVQEQKKNLMAQKIFEGNIKLIKEADIIIANLNNFRGLEPDSGTAFECGVGYALGKKVYGYIDDSRAIIEKYPFNKTTLGECVFDTDGLIIEDFELPLNLMLSCSATIIKGDFEQCLRKIKNEGLY